MSEVVGFSQKGFVRLSCSVEDDSCGKIHLVGRGEVRQIPATGELGRSTTAWRVEDIENLIGSFK